ncbi:hypothetical protein [Catenulispora pinisilvae]|nr:hypothetical protein [Catenulispora pinisilvae]
MFSTFNELLDDTFPTDFLDIGGSSSGHGWPITRSAAFVDPDRR